MMVLVAFCDDSEAVGQRVGVVMAVGQRVGAVMAVGQRVAATPAAGSRTHVPQDRHCEFAWEASQWESEARGQWHG